VAAEVLRDDPLARPRNHQRGNASPGNSPPAARPITHGGNRQLINHNV
jgi:hypothetical protein